MLRRQSHRQRLVFFISIKGTSFNPSRLSAGAFRVRTTKLSSQLRLRRRETRWQGRRCRLDGLRISGHRKSDSPFAHRATADFRHPLFRQSFGTPLHRPRRRFQTPLLVFAGQCTACHRTMLQVFSVSVGGVGIAERSPLLRSRWTVHFKIGRRFVFAS